MPGVRWQAASIGICLACVLFLARPRPCAAQQVEEADPVAQPPAARVTFTAEQIDQIIADISDPDPTKRQTAQILVRNLPAEAYETIRDRFKAQDLDPETQIALARSTKMLAVRYLKDKRLKEAAAWRKKQVLLAYDEEGDHDPKWDAAARAALAKLGDRANEHEDADAADILLTLTRLVDSGCTDPVVVTVQTAAQVDWRTPASAARGAVKSSPWPTVGLTPGMPERMRAAADAIRHGHYPALLKCLACQTAIRTIVMSNGDQNEARRYLTASLDALPEAIKTPGYPPERQMVLVSNQLQLEMALDPKANKEAAFKRLYPLYASIAPGSYGPLLFKGKAYVTLAMDARGTVPEDEVTPGALKLFHERLTTAEEALDAAWQLDPKAWAVPTEMIALKIYQDGGRDEMEKWFKRAMDADPDNLEACRNKLYYLSPERKGNEEEMLAFGRECMETGNFRGRVAFVLIDAHRAIARESGEADAYFRRPGVWESIKRVYEGALQVFPDSTFDRSMYARLAYAGGEFAEAHRQFGRLGEAGDVNVFGGPDRYDWTRLDSAKRVLALGRPAAPPDPAQLARQAADEEFAAALQEAASDNNPGARDMMTALRSVAGRFQEIPVGTEPGKARWQKVTLNAMGKGIDCVRFRTPKGQPQDMRWAFVMGRGRLASWYIMRTDVADMRGFSEFNPMGADQVREQPGPGDGGAHGLTLQQLPANRLLPDTEYLLWFRFRSGQPVPTSVAINFVPPAGNADWRVLLKDLGMHWIGDPQ